MKRGWEKSQLLFLRQHKTLMNVLDVKIVYIVFIHLNNAIYCKDM